MKVIEHYSYSLFLVLLVIWMYTKIYLISLDSYRVLIQKDFVLMQLNIDKLDIVFFIIVFVYGWVLAAQESSLRPEKIFNFKYPFAFLMSIAVPYIIISSIYNKIF